MTIRNPNDPGWPARGERTELADVADRWKWKYVDWIDNQHRTRVLGRPAVRLLGEAAEAYLEHRLTSVARGTFTNDRGALRNLREDFSDKTPVEATDPQRTLDRMLRDRERWMPSSVKSASRSLSAFFAWLEIPYKVRLPKEQPRRAHCWTDEQVEAVRENAGKLLLPLDCALFMGLRLREIWGLRWEDVGRDVVRIARQYPDRPLKSKRERTAVILPGWEHKRGTGRVVTLSWKRRDDLTEVLTAAGVKVEGVAWHAGRHTYARRFLEAEPNMRLLQASLGHHSVKTTEELYNWLLPDEAAEIARARIHRRRKQKKRS